MTMISDLSWDLVEEVLAKVPINSLRAVRSTCKLWNALSKEESFTKKHCGKAPEEFLMSMTWGDSYSNSSRSFSLHNIKDLPSLIEIGKIQMPLRVIDILKVYFCDALLLCIPKDNSKLVVWNPYSAQIRCIQTRNAFYGVYGYAIGYNNNNNYKVLKFLLEIGKIVMPEIYDFESNSWSALDITTDFNLTHHRCVSLKGNTYFFGAKSSEECFVICFDFTTEKFGPRLHLPFHPRFPVEVIPSCVRGEQLGVLNRNSMRECELEIWITNKIEPNAVSWSKFFKVDMKPHFVSYFEIRSFFIDKKKKVVVVCGIHRRQDYERSYMVEEDGSYKEIGLNADVFSDVPSPVPIQ